MLPLVLDMGGGDSHLVDALLASFRYSRLLRVE